MQTSPQAKRILCFGDSNTWGYVPGSKHQRYPADVRWTGVLQSLLGNDFEIIEEGLNSRGILKGDSRPGKEGRSAIEYILPCLDTHDPIDYVIVFLGTNELKSEYNLSASEIAENARTLVSMISSRSSQSSDAKPKVVLVVPPKVDEKTEYSLKGEKYVSAGKKSQELTGAYSKVAQECGVQFLGVQDELATGSDGIHLTAEAHTVLAKALVGVFNKI